MNLSLTDIYDLRLSPKVNYTNVPSPFATLLSSLHFQNFCAEWHLQYYSYICMFCEQLEGKTGLCPQSTAIANCCLQHL